MSSHYSLPPPLSSSLLQHTRKGRGPFCTGTSFSVTSLVIPFVCLPPSSSSFSSSLSSQSVISIKRTTHTRAFPFSRPKKKLKNKNMRRFFTREMSCVRPSLATRQRHKRRDNSTQCRTSNLKTCVCGLGGESCCFEGPIIRWFVGSFVSRVVTISKHSIPRPGQVTHTCSFLLL